MPVSISFFKNFMASHGIFHQTSCAYTLQQDRVAKCKNKHLVKITSTMIGQATTMPQRSR